MLTQKSGLKRSFTTPANGISGTNGASKTGASSDLLGLDLAASDATAPNLASAAHLSPDWDIGFNRLFFVDEGVLFEDAQIQVGLRSEYRGHLGVCKLYFTNKSSFSIGSFTTTLDNPSPTGLKVDTKSLPEPDVLPASQTQQTVCFECLGPFTKAPTIRISYLAGALQAYTLQLPVLMHRYMDASGLASDDFFKRWRQIGGGPLESQSTFGLVNIKNRTINEASTRQIVEGFKWKILPGVDPNPKNIVGCAVYQAESRKTGCLMRLEPNYEKMMYRITIRATQEDVPPALVKLMEERLAQGVSNDDMYR
ncbi:AP-2 complex subunit alpha [Coccidioides immitis H538.4]|nr:AP-2 complex subunit alpha [Coccidioides immitis H538.4]